MDFYMYRLLNTEVVASYMTTWVKKEKFCGQIMDTCYIVMYNIMCDDIEVNACMCVVLLGFSVYKSITIVVFKLIHCCYYY